MLPVLRAKRSPRANRASAVTKWKDIISVKKEQDNEGFLRNVRYRCIDIHTEPAKHSTNDRIVERERER